MATIQSLQMEVGLPGVIALALATLAVYETCVVIYRIFFHPLRRFPGPKLAAATHLYEAYFNILKAPGGQFMYQLSHLHDIYGPIVRITPDEVHVRDSGWLDVLYTGPGPVRNKGPRAVNASRTTGSVAATPDHSVHRARRTAIGPYFSKHAVSSMEGQVIGKTDLLCQRLREKAKTDQVVDIWAALTACTLDIISEYCYDQSWNALDGEDLGTRWRTFFGGEFEGVMARIHFPFVYRMMELIPLFIVRKLVPDVALALDNKALTDGVSRKVWKDFQSGREKTTDGEEKPKTIFHGIMNSSLPDEEKSVERLSDEAFVLVIAGGETTARVSTVILTKLIERPKLLARLREELSAVVKEGKLPESSRMLEEIPLLKAIVQEGLRCGAPVTIRPERVLPNEDLAYQDWTIPRGVSIRLSIHTLVYLGR
jgi:cytochrome P450